MLRETNLAGIFVPVVTPFLPSEAMDMASYRRLLGELLNHKISGLIINSTTGESPSLSWEEVATLYQAAREELSSRQLSLPIVIGTGSNYTAAAVKQTELAGELGADAVLVVTPYFNRPPQEGVVEHYRRVAETGMPVIAYEVPSRTSLRLTVDTVRRILDLDGVIGLKDSTGGTDLITALASDDTKPILCGDDLFFYEMLELGAAGGILASAHLHTDRFLEVFRQVHRGERQRAEDTFHSLVPLIKKLFLESNPAPLKWVLAQRGLIATDTLRLPMRPISLELQYELEKLRGTGKLGISNSVRR